MKAQSSRKSLVSIASTVALCAVSLFEVAHIHGATSTKRPELSQLTIDNFTFTAPSVTVSAGTEVTWVNRDDIPHTVTSEDGVFHSKALDTDDRFSFEFAKPGTYRYFCSIHPKMTGEIVVK